MVVQVFENHFQIAPFSKYAYPWRCLKRGFFLLITNNLPFLFTILQSTLRFLMEALTFIVCFFISFLLLLSACCR